MIPEWPGEADGARLILAIETHQPAGWRGTVAGWWWTAWDGTWGRARRAAGRRRWTGQECPDDDYTRTVEACLLATERLLAHTRERERLLTGALGDTTHPYADPGGGDTGCEREVPAGERMVPGQVCGQSEWHPVHRTPDVVLDGTP